MKKKLTTICSLLIIAAVSFAGGLDSLTGKTFKLDKETTKQYLKDNQVFPVELLPKLDKFMDHLVVKWNKESIDSETWSGTASSEYKVVAETENKMGNFFTFCRS